MTYGAFTSREIAAYDNVRAEAKPIPQTILCAGALVLSSAVGLFLMYHRPAGIPDAPVPAPAPVHATAAAPVPRTAPAIPPLRRLGALLDPTFTARLTPGAFAQSAPLRSSFEPLRRPATLPTVTAQIVVPAPIASHVAALPTRLPPAPQQVAKAEPAKAEVAKVEVAKAEIAAPEVDVDTDTPAIPLPTPRPTYLTAVEPAPVRAPARTPAAARPTRLAEAEVPAAPAPVAAPAPAPVAPGAPASQGSGFFDKLFGGAARPGNALGYASSEDGFFGRGSASADRYTAVYDITRHTVTLPDGTRLEAHSGLGDLVDNPAGVTVRMRGATPPNMYELKEREAIFHGVRALRMTPTGGTTYGRGGLLTHSYMLRGRSGESNGCVVFANYPAFLRAYDSGMVRRLLVVARAS